MDSMQCGRVFLEDIDGRDGHGDGGEDVFVGDNDDDVEGAYDDDDASDNDD